MECKPKVPSSENGRGLKKMQLMLCSVRANTEHVDIANLVNLYIKGPRASILIK